MARFWSAENATKAYLKTLKMGNKPNEPDEVEFISALAAGNNAQLMVAVCDRAVGPTVLALVAAAHQTGGRVACILRGNEELERSKGLILGLGVCHIEFAIGDAQSLLLAHYKDADFVLVDCDIENHMGIMRSVQMAERNGAVTVVGFNALRKGSSFRSNNHNNDHGNVIMGWRTQLLPIGEGLLVTRVNHNNSNYHGKISINGTNNNNNNNSGKTMRSRGPHTWVVKVDKCTGEEHVFRVRSSSSHGTTQIKA